MPTPVANSAPRPHHPCHSRHIDLDPLQKKDSPPARRPPRRRCLRGEDSSASWTSRIQLFWEVVHTPWTTSTRPRPSTEEAFCSGTREQWIDHRDQCGSYRVISDGPGSTRVQPPLGPHSIFILYLDIFRVWLNQLLLLAGTGTVDLRQRTIEEFVSSGPSYRPSLGAPCCGGRRS